jgi:hypothetical protein
MSASITETSTIFCATCPEGSRASGKWSLIFIVAAHGKKNTNVMPWEHGTRQEGGSLAQAVARDFKTAGIDGVNGDTMNGIGKEFPAAADAEGHPLAFEPEVSLRDLADLQWDPLSWGYWQYPPVPSVDRYKWFEPRHLIIRMNTPARGSCAETATTTRKASSGIFRAILLWINTANICSCPPGRIAPERSAFVA